MSIPKKTSRPIRVEGRRYRWMARRTSEVSKVRLTVEDQETGELHQTTIRSWEKGDAPVVTPARVKEFILYRFPRPGQ